LRLLTMNQTIKNIFNWLLILLPPLLLTPLLFIPLDMFTMLFWGPAFLIFLVSAWHILQFLAKRLRGQTQFRKELIRPLLAILIIVAAAGLVAASRHSADEFGRRIARNAQQICNERGECPLIVEGLSHLEGRTRGLCRTSYGDYGAKFVITYSASEDRKTFQVTVRHNIDEALILQGGVHQELHETLQVY